MGHRVTARRSQELTATGHIEDASFYNQRVSRGRRRALRGFARRRRRVLVIDVGGTHIKLYGSGHGNFVKIDSGPKMTPGTMIKAVRHAVHGWQYDVVSIGYPGPVACGKPLRDPAHLGRGWVRFDFRKGFRCPVRVLNDAAMQALGSYHGGRMLFLGLGTGLGSAMIIDGILQPLELAHLPYGKDHSLEDRVGTAALAKRGIRKWKKAVIEVVLRLKDALQADYVVIGGGNARHLKAVPSGCRVGDNAQVRRGGVLLWKPPSRPPKRARHTGVARG